jgi:hypothetical protein
MKKLLYSIVVIFVMAQVACSKYDNFDEPGATLTGRVVDAGNKGAGIQTEPSGGGTRIKLEEISWSDNPTPFYFNGMHDGRFNNTKLFPGTNKVSVEGAFVPMVQTDASGNITVDNRKTVELGNGVTELTFEVEPFLRLQWVGEPVINADSTITVKVIVSRGTNNAAFQADVTDVNLYLNSVPYVGSGGNNDNRYSALKSYSGTSGNDILDQTLTITTIGKLPPRRSYWLRVGARTAYGLKQYNFTDTKTVAIP